MEGFTQEKDKLVKEVRRRSGWWVYLCHPQVAKWEDSNNDIIVLAKHMCSIMTDMTDFIKVREAGEEGTPRLPGPGQDKEHG